MLRTSAARLTRHEAKQVARVINYPIFVPELGHHVTHALVSGDLASFLGELGRLSTLGSRSASALLAYLYMRGAVDGVADLSRAEALCIEAARSGDPYSQYVMAWTCKAAGRDAEASNWLRKAAVKGLFLPAVVDMARFMAGGAGFVAPDTRAALAVLWDAHKLGHRMALVYIATVPWKASGSWMRRVLGAMLYPIAILRAWQFASRYPLSDQVFVTSLTTRRPIFKVSGVRQAADK